MFALLRSVRRGVQALSAPTDPQKLVRLDGNGLEFSANGEDDRFVLSLR